MALSLFCFGTKTNGEGSECGNHLVLTLRTEYYTQRVRGSYESMAYLYLSHFSCETNYLKTRLCPFQGMSVLGELLY